jgi:hypothetical protein
MTTLESRVQLRLAMFAAERESLPARREALERAVAEGTADADWVASETAALRKIASGDEEVEYLLATAPYIREYEETTVASHVHLDGFARVTSKSQKHQVLQQYLADVEQRTDAVTPAFYRNDDAAKETSCERCDATLLFNTRESSMVCSQCGFVLTFMELSDANLTYDQEVNQDVVSSFAYKRLNHFCEWVNSLQAKENTEIPENVIEAVRAEFKKARITQRGDIKPTRVREYLKKLGFNKFYEHTNYVVSILNGVPPPKLTRELEEKLKAMFSKIQEPFNRNCPPTRKNFLSYSYVLFKFCELLGEDDLLPHFPLLKSAEKLFAQDKIWRKICQELGWQFIPSV